MLAFDSRKNTADYLRILLQAGADVKSLDVYENTALHHLVFWVMARSVKSHGDHAFRLNWIWPTYQTGESLDTDMELVNMMCAAGAGKSQENGDGHKPLDQAADWILSLTIMTVRDIKREESVQRLMQHFGITRLNYDNWEEL